MVKSGIQQEVINMYRRGVKLAYSRPKEHRQEFLLHLRYGFHHPPIGRRDYTAIEHQLRKMDRTLEMLETGNVQRLHVTEAMVDWWAQQTQRNTRSTSHSMSTESTTQSTEKGDVTKRGDSKVSEHQWGGTLPGRGGT